MRTRYAPSPTGLQHIGNVRTALFAFLAAKNVNGKFYLRIEDTDRSRFVEGAEETIKESLNWLGLNWDEDVVRQSERLSIYEKYAKQLIDKGLAYADPYSSKQVDEFRNEAKSNKQAFLYRNYRPENPPVWDGTQPLRLKIETLKRYEWEDLVRGKLSAGEDALDDFVLLKAKDEEGKIYPTYNFAHIIDDFEMGITHIFRGEEFIASMPKFLSLYDALDIEWPKFATVPPILGKEGGKKLSKREGATSVQELKDEGYLPQAIINFLASLGFNDGTDKEVYSLDELINIFAIDRIQKSPARYDIDKLNWLNWEHFKLGIKKDNQHVLELLKSRDIDVDVSKFKEVSELVLTKANSLDSFIEQLAIFYPKLEPKIRLTNLDLYKISDALNLEAAKVIIGEVIELLEDCKFSASDIENSLRSFINDSDYDNRTVLNLIRTIISGIPVSPNLFDMLAVLGKNESIARLKKSLE